jgi:hypothetical protein
LSLPETATPPAAAPAEAPAAGSRNAERVVVREVATLKGRMDALEADLFEDDDAPEAPPAPAPDGDGGAPPAAPPLAPAPAPAPAPRKRSWLSALLPGAADLTHPGWSA